MLVDARVIAFGAILLVTGLWAAGNEHNDPDGEVHERAAVDSMARSGDILSLQQILQNARQQHAGRVLEAELEEGRGGLYYEVEILDANGEVWEMSFDARSGELLEEGQED
jgi:uncharacterized membrane protein YkoI